MGEFFWVEKNCQKKFWQKKVQKILTKKLLKIICVQKMKKNVEINI